MEYKSVKHQKLESHKISCINAVAAAQCAWWFFEGVLVDLGIRNKSNPKPILAIVILGGLKPGLESHMHIEKYVY